MSVEPNAPVVNTLRDDVFVGVGLGVFIGLAVGLSSSPVVSVIVTAIGGILASVVGLRTSDGPFGLRPLRVGTLGLSASVSLLLGLWLRAHDVLSPSAADEVDHWQTAGFSQRDALALTAARRTDASFEILEPTPKERVDAFMKAGMSRKEALLHLSAEGSAKVTRSAPKDPAPKPTNSVLFAEAVPDAFCGELEQKRYDVAEALRLWKARGGAWQPVAEFIAERVPVEHQKIALERIRVLACRMENNNAQFDDNRSATGDAE